MSVDRIFAVSWGVVPEPNLGRSWWRLAGPTCEYNLDRPHQDGVVARPCQVLVTPPPPHTHTHTLSCLWTEFQGTGRSHPSSESQKFPKPTEAPLFKALVDDL